MTIETRGLIEPKDIVAIEFECRKCGARLVMALEGIQQVPTSCSRCDDTWVIHSSQEHGRLHHFVQKLKDFATATNDPYILRFEVKGLGDVKK